MIRFKHKIIEPGLYTQDLVQYMNNLGINFYFDNKNYSCFYDKQSIISDIKEQSWFNKQIKIYVFYWYNYGYSLLWTNNNLSPKQIIKYLAKYERMSLFK